MRVHQHNNFKVIHIAGLSRVHRLLKAIIFFRQLGKNHKQVAQSSTSRGAGNGYRAKSKGIHPVRSRRSKEESPV